MKRKASLQLSINAIVIIILAVTLLGLGLTFMRQFIGEGSENLIGVFDAVELENPATALNPITVPSRIELKAGEQRKIVDVGFYCDDNTECNPAQPILKKNTQNPQLACTGKNEAISPATNGVPVCDGGAPGSNCDGSTNIEFISTEEKVESKSSIGYKMLIKKNGDVQGTFVCTLAIKGATGQPDYESTQIFITTE